MSEKIINIYKFRTKNGQESYIYSLKENDDYLKYDYYLLSENEYGELEIKPSANTINLLQNNEINLTPIKKNNPEYEVFIQKLLATLQKEEQKKEVLPRR